MKTTVGSTSSPNVVIGDPVAETKIDGGLDFILVPEKVEERELLLWENISTSR